MASLDFARDFQRKILMLVTLVGLLSVGGCYTSSGGFYAHYDEPVSYGGSYCECPSAYLYGHLTGCRFYEPSYYVEDYAYPQFDAGTVVDEAIVEQANASENEGRNKPGRSNGQKSTRKSNKKTY